MKPPQKGTLIVFSTLIAMVIFNPLIIRGANVIDLKKQRLTKSFSGVQGAVFQKSPLAAGGVKSTLLARGAQDEPANVEQLYRDAQFLQLVQYFEKKDYPGLSLQEKLLFIESLARTSQGLPALEKIEPLLKDHAGEAEVLAVAAAVYLSLGEMDRASAEIHRALVLKPDCEKAIYAKIVLLLYQREFSEAGQWFDKLLNIDRDWAGSEFVFLIGIDVYRALQNPVKLSELFKARAARVKKINKQYYQSLNADAQMYKKAGENLLLQVEFQGEKAVIPFTPGERSLRVNTISITIAGKTFKVLLDTGNATGWLVHSRELKELLKPKTGGRTLTRIGTESGVLDGYWEYYRTVDFNAFKIHHLSGIYVPKPHPDFPDANFNPARIRDRVVAIDFARNEMELQTREQFEKELAGLPQESYTRLPWFGYKYPSVAVKVMDKQGMGMIETGAEDIAIKLDFIKSLPLQLIPKMKYLADGQVFKYHQTAVSVSVGGFNFERKGAEVWPLERFYNRLTGVSPDVVLGPKAFEGMIRVAFDPFNKQIVLSKRK